MVLDFLETKFVYGCILEQEKEKKEDEKEYSLSGVEVFGTFLLFNGHESTEVTIAITAHIGAPIAGQL